MKKTKSTLAVIYPKYMAYLAKQGVSRSHLSFNRLFLGAAIESFGDRSLESISPDEFVRGAKPEWGPRSVRGYIGCVRNLCRWAQDHDYAPYERKLFIERVRNPKLAVQDPEFYTPEEMRRLLREGAKMVGQKTEFLFLLLILGGFVGMRTSEICRLRWEDMLLSHKSIKLSSSITKTRLRRIAKIPDNAMEWLSHVKPSHGVIVPQHLVQNLTRFTGDLTRAAGVEWKKNGLRHSYVTYAMAKERNAWEVSEQVGNTPRVLQVHYKGLVLASDADEWFSITPNSTL
jgi:integrase